MKVDGHYQKVLPWKFDSRKLSNNRQIAERRLYSLKQRFVRNPEFFQLYCEKLVDYISNGYARGIPKESSVLEARTWYIPHHAIAGKFQLCSNI